MKVEMLKQRLAAAEAENESLRETVQFLNCRLNEAIKTIHRLPSKHKNEQAPLANIPRWIPVDERLPENDSPVLAIDGYGDYGLAVYSKRLDLWEATAFGRACYEYNGGWDRSPDRIFGDVVAWWMPLPDAPGGEG